jgi:hypothetical protein
MKRPCWSLFALLLCLPVLPSVAQDEPPAQTSPPTTKAKPKTTTPKKTTKSKTANVKVGVITKIDAENSEISINEKTATNTYTLTEKTRYRKNKADVELEAFKVGEQITLKLRKVRNKDEYVVQELHDATSWDQISGIRSQPMQVTIRKIEVGELAVTFGAEKEPFVYVTSDKTHWSKAGKDAEPKDFKVGEVVTVVPRSLPSGNVMAAIVADSAKEATRTKERHARSVAGQIASLDGNKWQIVLALSPQDTREFSYSPKTLVKLGSRPMTVAALKVGQKIRASLKQVDEELPEAYRITIEAKKTATTAKTKSKTALGETGKTLKSVVPNKK